MCCKAQPFRTGSLEHFDFPTMSACLDPSSMRFVPWYHNTKICEKSGVLMVRADDFPDQRERRRSLAQCCTNDNSMRFIPLYAAIRDDSPLRRRESVSCDGFATSSPLQSVSRSSQSKFLQPSRLLVVNSTDSGILIDSPSFEDSSFGTPEKPSCVSSEHGRRISILKRSQTSHDDLNTSIRRCAEEVKRPVSRDLCSMFKRFAIPEDIKDSSEDEGPVFCSHKRGGRRPRVSTRRRVFRKSSYKFPATTRASKNEGNTSASVASSPGPQLWDDNNNKTAEDSSSTISAPRRASKIHQLFRPESSTVEWCTFCKSNNETEDFMRSHALKMWEPSSRVFKLTCPVLRNYVCPRCGATGDAAHTFTYCPETIKEVGYRPKSLITKFKCTTHDSSGRKRMHTTLQSTVRRSI